MSFLGLPTFLGKPLAVMLIDLLLAGDNAVVIALVCLSLPRHRLRWVVLLGTVGAVVLRVALCGLAGTVLAAPGLKLAGGALLALLAVNLSRPERSRPPAQGALDERSGVLAAALLVTLADVLMSLDNVIALAAVAGDSPLYLGLGLLLSVSILMFGSALVGRLLRRHPDLARFGVALLGWVAGKMVVSDGLLDGWIAVQSPALTVIVPAVAAAYVYLLGGTAPAPAFEAMPARPAARRAPRQRRAAAPPRFAARALPVQAEGAKSNRSDLLMFGALFAIVGVFLGIALLLGESLAR